MAARYTAQKASATMSQTTAARISVRASRDGRFGVSLTRSSSLITGVDIIPPSGAFIAHSGRLAELDATTPAARGQVANGVRIGAGTQERYTAARPGMDWKADARTGWTTAAAPRMRLE